MSQNSSVLTQWAQGLTQEAMDSLEQGKKTTYFNFLASMMALVFVQPKAS